MQDREFELIGIIAERAEAHGITRDRMSTVMDITCVNDSIGLDLEGLAKAEPDHFRHDLIGITNCLNRNTGQLENCFTPRYAQ